uniref:PHD-type domain-containing protein n=1 Tax=Strongyloides venezuelensis TaxID=75913 RepID=A0A0K0EWA5_STRVS
METKLQSLEETTNKEIVKGIEILLENADLFLDEGNEIMNQILYLVNKYMNELCQKTAVYANLNDKRTPSIDDVHKALEAQGSKPHTIYDYVKQYNTQISRDCNCETLGSTCKNSAITPKNLDPKEKAVKDRLEEFYAKQNLEEPGFSTQTSKRAKYLMRCALGDFYDYKPFFTFVPCPWKHVNDDTIEHSKSFQPTLNAFQKEETLLVQDESNKQAILNYKLDEGFKTTTNATKLHGLYPDSFIHRYENSQNIVSQGSLQYTPLNTNEECRDGTMVNVEHNNGPYQQSLLTENIQTRHYYDPKEDNYATLNEVDKLIDDIIDKLAKSDESKNGDTEDVVDKSEKDTSITDELFKIYSNNSIDLQKEVKNTDNVIPLSCDITNNEATKENLRVSNDVEKPKRSLPMKVSTDIVRVEKKICFKPIIGPLIPKPLFRTIPKVVVCKSLNDFNYHHKKKLILVKRIDTDRTIGRNQLSICDTVKCIIDKKNLSEGKSVESNRNDLEEAKSTNVVEESYDTTKLDDNGDGETQTTSVIEDSVKDKVTEDTEEAKTSKDPKEVVEYPNENEVLKVIKTPDEVEELRKTEISKKLEQLKMLEPQNEVKEGKTIKATDEVKESMVTEFPVNVPKEIEVPEEVKVEKVKAAKIPEISVLEDSNDMEIKNYSNESTSPPENLEETKENTPKKVTQPDTTSIKRNDRKKRNTETTEDVSSNNNEQRKLRSKKIKEELIDEGPENDKHKNIHNSGKDKNDANNDKKGSSKESTSKKKKTNRCPVCNNSYYIKKNPMICCDECEFWYHFSCVDLKPKDVPEEDPWFCSRCKRKGSSRSRKRKHCDDYHDNKRSLRRRTST